MSAEVRLGAERAVPPALAKYRSFCRPVKHSQDYCLYKLGKDSKEGKKTNNKIQIHQHTCKVTNYFYTDTASSFSTGLSMLLGNYGGTAGAAGGAQLSRFLWCVPQALLNSYY